MPRRYIGLMHRRRCMFPVSLSAGFLSALAPILVIFESRFEGNTLNCLFEPAPEPLFVAGLTKLNAYLL